MTTNSEAAIFSRVLEPEKPMLSPDAARSILALDFSPADRDRMNALAAKARDGALSGEENEELENFLRVGDLLAIMQSKARRSFPNGASHPCSAMQKSLEDEVWQRANGLCEYCHLPQVYHRVPFQIDHVIAEQHGGQTVSENLAVACLRCNKRKGPNIAGVDSDSGEIVRLFNPRMDRWSEHFQWDTAMLIGLTPIGRATIAMLAINHSSAVGVREELMAEGVFPG